MSDYSLEAEAKHVLLQLTDLLQHLSIDEYTEKIPLLSHSSIGEHTRHIIELFQQLYKGYDLGVVNYDARERELLLQSNIDYALESLACIVSNLCIANKNITITTLYTNEDRSVESNYHRELMYNIEHCIHHQAIIKIALNTLGITKVDEFFGVAKSTIAYKKQCVQ